MEFYIVEFQYCKNPNEDIPIIVVDKHIGFDETDGVGIMGGQFIDEFFSLSGQGKKQCEVWINSPGGKMMEAYDMFGVMKRSPMQPDTLNIGMAASCGGWLQLAGKRVKMMDYATFMCHNPSGPDGEDAAAIAMKMSVAKLISENSGRNNVPKLTMDEAIALMDRTSFIGAEECRQLGLCDEVVPSGYNEMFASMTDKWEAGKQYLNSVLPNKNTKMENISLVTNELELNENSSANAIAKAVNKLKTELDTKTKALTEATNKLTAVTNSMDAMNDYEDLKKSVNDMTDKVTTITNENKALTEKVNALEAEKVENAKAIEEAENKAKEAKNEADCMNMVNGYTNKIGSDAEIIAEWVGTAKEMGIDKVKNMLDRLPVYRQGTKVSDFTNKVKPGSEVKPANTMADVMARQNQKLKESRK